MIVLAPFRSCDWLSTAADAVFCAIIYRGIGGLVFLLHPDISLDACWFVHVAVWWYVLLCGVHSSLVSSSLNTNPHGKTVASWYRACLCVVVVLQWCRMCCCRPVAGIKLLAGRFVTFVHTGLASVVVPLWLQGLVHGPGSSLVGVAGCPGDGVAARCNTVTARA
jgi:hypothetical protein